MEQGLIDIKQGARNAWATGRYDEIAERFLWGVGEVAVGHAGVTEGERVLDVACGTGNAAIRAAQAGAKVTGVDLTPELFDDARRRAADAGVEAEWLEGDAEDLPAAAESFDVAISVFGCMFAPRHRVAAGELARVLAPGGRLVVTAWTPESLIGRFFGLMGSYMPPPPDFAQPPPLWGDEEHVRELFEGTGVELSFERESVEFNDQFDSPEEQLEFNLERFGPLILAREHTREEGTWDELRGRILEHYSEDVPSEYLITIGRKTS